MLSSTLYRRTHRSLLSRSVTRLFLLAALILAGCANDIPVGVGANGSPDPSGATVIDIAVESGDFAMTSDPSMATASYPVYDLTDKMLNEGTVLAYTDLGAHGSGNWYPLPAVFSEQETKQLVDYHCELGQLNLELRSLTGPLSHVAMMAGKQQIRLVMIPAEEGPDDASPEATLSYNELAARYSLPQ